MYSEILQGKCPACTNPYTPRATSIAFVEQLPGHRILVVYALCHDCKAAYESGSTETCTSIRNTCFCNVKLSGESPGGWKITNSLAYEAHGGDFYSAWVYGVSIPKIIFKAIDQGLIKEGIFFPGGYASC